MTSDVSETRAHHEGTKEGMNIENIEPSGDRAIDEAIQNENNGIPPKNVARFAAARAPGN